MTNVAHAWVMTGGVRRDFAFDRPPPCDVPGAFHNSVRWVLAAVRNPSGLPGQGTEVVAFACAQHLHRVAQQLSEGAVSGVTLTVFIP